MPGRYLSTRARRTRQFAILILISTAMAVAGAAEAGTVKLSNSTVGSNGGPFIVTVVAPIGTLYSAGATFPTFCLEKGETFVPGRVYETVISDRAVYGTNGNQNGADVLESATAWLYRKWRAGVLGGLIPDDLNGSTPEWSGSNGDLKSLQDAIWELEGESSNTSGATAGMKARLKSLALSTANGTLYNVRVMQLWDVGYAGVRGHEHQDQLILVPSPTSVTAGAGLLAVVGVYSKRRRRLRDV